MNDWIFVGFFSFFIFLRSHLRHMEVLRPGVELELKLQAYTSATATPDPSQVCDLHHSSQQCQILNPQSEARDWTCVLMDTSWTHFCCAMTGSPKTEDSKVPHEQPVANVIFLYQWARLSWHLGYSWLGKANASEGAMPLASIYWLTCCILLF